MARILQVLCVLLVNAGPALAQTPRALLRGPAPSQLFAFGAGPAPPTRDTVAKVIPPTQWKLGLLVGGIVGGLALGYVGYGLCHDDHEIHESCFAPAVGGLAIGAVIGGGLGALIGGQFPKREEADSRPQAACWPADTIGETPSRPGADQLAALGGRYEVTMVNVRGEHGDSVVHGVLILWPNDSARRYLPRQVGRRPGERPLAGRFESKSTTVPSTLGSHERGTWEDPAVEMVGATIFLGGLEYSEAGGGELEVQQLTQTGFRGAWSQNAGFSITVDSATGRKLSDPGGYFCAVRVPKA